ncbi:hypothetical protein [Stackebrandtia nassauensis]|uniref:Uncharacterized protein n=1 Tax=Stackebrandtia nassauensis (strain DSM 44728 / CIP 108903 / NRRL B-16338 / NBRC 102104 / LLR-40K-21) TaxID=446470 RepID=D3Q2C5_STANL|nr:hypothetical protein [Stackebrandtia nassauensis]ADD43858.1 hypothetical protein Snas_4209 [Stackebrandtia nassauensis DSM 44728]
MPTVVPPTQNPPTDPAPVALDDCGALVSSLRHAEAMAAQWSDAAAELRRVLIERLGDAELGTINGHPAVRHTTYRDTRVSTKMLRELAPADLIERCTTTTTRRRFTLVDTDSGVA